MVVLADCSSCSICCNFSARRRRARCSRTERVRREHPSARAACSGSSSSQAMSSRKLTIRFVQLAESLPQWAIGHAIALGSTVGLPSLAQPLHERHPAPSRTALIGKHTPCATQQPRQGVGREIIKAPPGNHEDLADCLIRRGWVYPPKRITPHRRGVLEEQVLEVLTAPQIAHTITMSTTASGLQRMRSRLRVRRQDHTVSSSRPRTTS